MPATPRRLSFPQEVLDRPIGGAPPERDYDYNDIEVGMDYVATLIDTGDYDKRDQGKTQGWVFTYEVLGAPFTEYLSFGDNARWKIKDVMAAHEIPLEAVSDLDPNTLVGSQIGVHIDWQTDPDLLEEGAPNYREIKSFFPVSYFEDEEAEDFEAEEPEVL